MKTKTSGIIIIALGITMMVYTGFTFITTKKVVDLGPIKINKEKNHLIQWPPIIGVLLTIGGIVLIARDIKKS